MLADEPYTRHWVSFSSESEEGERALKNPLSMLREEFPDIGDDWQVVTMFVNHQRAFSPHGQIHFCQEWMIIPEMKSAFGVTFKH